MSQEGPLDSMRIIIETGKAALTSVMDSSRSMQKDVLYSSLQRQWIPHSIELSVFSCKDSLQYRLLS